MSNGGRRVSKPLSSPQKFRPGAPAKKKASALGDPLLLAPDVLDDATRRELLHDVLRPLRASPSCVERPSGVSRSSGDAHGEKEPFAHQLRSRVQASSHNSDDLVTAMAARLKDLEALREAHQAELHELHSKYRQLNDSYQRERKLREEAETAVLTLYDEKEVLEGELRAWREEGNGESGSGPSAAGAAVSSSSQATSRSPSPSARRRNEGNQSCHDNQPPLPTPALPSSPSQASAVGETSKFDLYEGVFHADGADTGTVIPTHFVNTARPGTQLFSPRKSLTEEGHKAAEKKQQRPLKQQGRQSVDLALLHKNARILSDYVGWKGVVKHGNQANIKERDVVRVVVYQNGICVNRGPFRPYGWALCDAFLDDLLDGYYPYEFKEKYPDGFPIEVTDRSAEVCEVDHHGAARSSVAKRPSPSSPSFQNGGDGRRLGGTPLAAGQPRPIHTLQDVTEKNGYTPVSAAEFLRRIPAQKVTASGQLVSVRDDVAALMGGKGTRESVSHGTIKHVTAAEVAYQTVAEDPAPTATATAVDMTTPPSMAKGNLIALLVRLPDGLKVTLHMAPTDTVASLRRELAAAVPQVSTMAYELFQAYPTKAEWKDHQRTLASLGVEKSGTLMIKRY